MSANTIPAPANTTPDVSDAAPTAPAAPPAAADYPAAWDEDMRRVWDALTATGGGTVAVIAKTAGTPQKAVRDALKTMVDLGQVVRDGDVWRPTPATPGHDGRDAAPDAPAPNAPATDGAATDGAATDAPVTDGDTAPAPDTPAPVPALTPEKIADAMRIMGEESGRRAAAKADLEERERREEDRRAAAVAELARAHAIESAREGLADLIASATAAYAAVADGADADAIITALVPVFDAVNALAVATGNARPRRARTTGGMIPTGGPVATGDRKPPTPLRPAVAAHMNAHPYTDFTPGEIARVLDRSSGAVANALATMATQGDAVLTCERPMRYRAATPADADNAATGTDTAA
ncbi:hypothetical protein [Actinomadura harenae]|uniref:Uncharacterized protein n=1 Tax=Actinomadura harenae TaxID=2483351 RepID=A0A3M2LLN9_9ACTN|nr:hypothetical protein [Actinomadura harenae]RMI38347.1 hypothetical protein EBO15_33100 [Actinomadura harenae]